MAGPQSVSHPPRRRSDWLPRRHEIVATLRVYLAYLVSSGGRLRDKFFMVPFVACVLAACSTTPAESQRIIVTLAPGVELADRAAFEQRVYERTQVKVTYAAAVSESEHAFRIVCDPPDDGCARARAALMASGLFTQLNPDRRRGYR